MMPSGHVRRSVPISIPQSEFTFGLTVFLDEALCRLNSPKNLAAMVAGMPIGDDK
jgi:hypothetical protein